MLGAAQAMKRHVAGAHLTVCSGTCPNAGALQAASPEEEETDREGNHNYGNTFFTRIAVSCTQSLDRSWKWACSCHSLPLALIVCASH
mmetsp:Transcript_109291/g.348863  ORF Transcript_109291/g.348863 Transcript_109291/m.348863 type:complete len:88 (-) Transcript_109291:497-760(-)